MAKPRLDDQHLLQDAPATSLHRLRKTELVRLWKVAGMWLSEEDEMDEGGEDARDLGKSELVEGLIKAVGFPLEGLRSEPSCSGNSLSIPRLASRHLHLNEASPRWSCEAAPILP